MKYAFVCQLADVRFKEIRLAYSFPDSGSPAAFGQSVYELCALHL